MTTAEDALYISVIFLFRLGHPPLRIPWNEITFSRTTWFLREYVVLTLGTKEQIPFRISKRMARNLGILDRFPDLNSMPIEAEPNFDTLDESFVKSLEKKPH
jgi:hypothetical protein